MRGRRFNVGHAHFGPGAAGCRNRSVMMVRDFFDFNLVECEPFWQDNEVPLLRTLL